MSTNMPDVQFGSTGLRVSRIVLGTSTFGSQCDESTSHAILDAAAAAGITFIDTADTYPMGRPLPATGETESIVGRWLRGRRDDYIVATKCAGVMGHRPWQVGCSRRHLTRAVEASLRRLGTDYIDLYQLHAFDPCTPMDETLAALDDLRQAGKVLYVGCSNFFAYQIALALGRSETNGWVGFSSVQPRYNLLFRQWEHELFPLCQEAGLAVLPYNALAGGFLAGKYRPDEAPPVGTRLTIAKPQHAGQTPVLDNENIAGVYRGRYWHDAEFHAIEELRALSSAAGVPMTQLALAWVLANPVVTAAIVGASRPSQVHDAVAAAQLVLAPEVRQRMEQLSEPFRGDWQPR